MSLAGYWTSKSSNRLYKATNSDLQKPYGGREDNFKNRAFNELKFNQMMVTNFKGDKFHVMHKWRHGDSWDSCTDLFNGKVYNWAERAMQQGGGMWNYPNWAINNVEPGNDRCHDGRIAVCKQERSGHTGGGTIIGTSCGGGSGANYNVWSAYNRGSRNGYTYNCVGSERETLKIDYDVKTFHIFVRTK